MCATEFLRVTETVHRFTLMNIAELIIHFKNHSNGQKLNERIMPLSMPLLSSLVCMLQLAS